MDLQADATHDLVATIVLHAQGIDPEDDGSGMGGPPIGRELHPATDHQLGEVLLVRLGRQSFAAWTLTSNTAAVDGLSKTIRHVRGSPVSWPLDGFAPVTQS